MKFKVSITSILFWLLASAPTALYLASPLADTRLDPDVWLIRSAGVVCGTINQPQRTRSLGTVGVQFRNLIGSRLAYLCATL